MEDIKVILLSQVLPALAVIILAPIVGGLLFGIDRKISARLQKRMGPPLLQPFYDFIKLYYKSRMACNWFQAVSVFAFLASMVVSLVMVVLGMDMLMMLFVLALGTVALIMGAFSVKSPYSQIGAQRELLQLLAYEPLLVFMIVAVYMGTGSFNASSVFQHNEPLLLSFPAFFITQVIVLAIKMHKSPFDISGSHHAHQELIKGIYTEFSGPYLALIELAHWYELVLLLGILAMFWWTNIWIGILIALLAYFIIIVLDNISARLTWSWMLKFAWAFGVLIAIINITLVFIVRSQLPAPTQETSVSRTLTAEVKISEPGR